MFNFVLFHRGTVEHVSQQFDTLLRELHGKFFKAYLSKMTSFWNFVAIGHSPPFVVQKQNFSELLPGFRLLVMEPAADQCADAEVNRSLVQEHGVGDLRSHLTRLFYKYSLPF